MYTQCPDCGTAFRVTADVLKQAAGKVRCGGCANAFNALDFLSEQMPEQSAAQEPEPQLPELTPDPEAAESGLPKSISAEQSAALLKTLDELAGSDIRIEDTGVEWRVLDEDDVSEMEEVFEAGEEPVQVDELLTEEGDGDIDEVLEDSPTPVDEFLTRTPDFVDAPEIFDESANGPAKTPVEELRFDDNTPLPEDFGFEDGAAVEEVSADDAVPEPEPESEPEPEPEPEPEIEAEAQPDLALSDPHEWTDILDEVEELAEEVAKPLDAELDALLEDESAIDDEEAEDEIAAEEALEEVAEEEAEEEAGEIAEEVTEEAAEGSIAELALDEEEVSDADDDTALDLIEEPLVESHTIEEELAALDEDYADDEAPEDDESGDSMEAADEADEDEHYVPPLSEEEQTVNMMIDQDLLAIAVEDEDGFASTIVIPESMAELAAAEKDADGVMEAAGEETVSDTGGDEKPSGESGAPAADSPVETIIMEGEFVRSAMDREKLAADAAAAAELQDAARAAEANAAEKNEKRRFGMIAGVVGLVLLLLIQVVHQSREALATIPAFNDTIGPVYRLFGSPLQPDWDVTGWRFEATNGNAINAADDNTAGMQEELVIYSRIGNKSDTPLPYPLIGVSLTDRFEEVIGSHIMDPADYLPNDLNPSKLVEPGNSFEASVTIRTPSPEVTGFKLNVCYRMTDEQLRCAIDDFK